MHRRSAFGLAGALACALGGCGTANNLLMPEKLEKGQPPGPVPAHVYGGVALDARVGSAWLTAPFLGQLPAEVSPVERAVDTTCKVAIATYLLSVDLPLSAVADTVTLPLTLAVTLRKHSEPGARAGARKTEDADEDAEASE